MFDNIEDPQFMSNYFAMELWINDNIPVAGETFREFVKELYQNNRLVRGEFLLGNRRVDLGRIICPLLLLMAKNDHLVAPASTEGIRPHVGSRDVESVVIDAGHGAFARCRPGADLRTAKPKPSADAAWGLPKDDCARFPSQS